MLAQDVFSNPWRFQAHPEVWMLVAFLVLAYVYVVKVIGPRAVPTGQPVVTRVNVAAFVGGITLLWVFSDWPVHDIAEEYLYSVHMLQHMALTYFMPPLVLLATPTWFARLLLGSGSAYGAVRWLSKPVVAAVLFNAGVMISHVPGVVNASVSNGLLHYTIHVLLVLTSLLMWMPVCGPLPEAHIAPFPKMIYLFMNSVVATVPAAWLTFAEGTVYRLYDQPVRVWGVSVTDDQQIAGAIMKVGGAVFLWTIIVVMFITQIARPHGQRQTYRVADDTLTFDEVDAAFRRSAAAPEPERTS
jgi:putative membrane protein